MALTKSGSARTVVTSQSCSAGGTVTSSGQSIGYGVSGVVKFTNGGTGPTVECQVRVEWSADDSTYYAGQVFGGSGIAANAVTPVDYSFGPGGAGGDWAYYRLVFTGNTGQAVTVQANDSTTTTWS